MATPFFIDCDHLIKFTGAKDINNDYINDGTCDYTITKKHGGTEIVSGTLDYVTDSDGNYQKAVDRASFADLEEGVFYFLDVTLSSPRSDDTHRKLELVARYQN